MEKVYENAMLIEVHKAGPSAQAQRKIDVFYDGVIIGDYFADIVVNNLVILDLKAAESLCVEHSYQLLNYLRATNIEVGL